MRKTLKYKGIRIEIRSINELDLLGFDSYIPVFEIDREHEENWINKAIDIQNEKIAREANINANKEFHSHIIDRCLIGCKLSLLRRVIFSIVCKGQSALDDIKRSDTWRTVILSEIYSISKTIENHKIKTSTAESIYYLYKGMNYADEYFKDTYLTAIEKYAFNRVIHNAGVTADNRRIKANG